MVKVYDNTDVGQLSALDRQLIGLLHLDGRVAFRDLARALQVSDRTVARRYSRLRAIGAIRVHAVTDAAALGQTQWYLRIACMPSAALDISRALVRRADTSWVSLISGGTEIVCATRARNDDDTGQLLLSQFPKTPRITQVSAQCELAVFTVGQAAYLLKQAGLTARQVEAAHGSVINRPRTVGEVSVQLDDLDRSLIAALVRDGRATTDELARALDVAPTTISRRIEALRQEQILHFAVEVDPIGLGRPVQTMAWLSVTPRHINRAAEQLASLPDVAFVAATTGRTNIYASLLSASVPALHRVLTNSVAGIPGLQSMETTVSISRAKRRRVGLT